MYLSALLSLYTQRIPFELDFRVTQVLTDSSGTSRYGDSGSILKNRKIGALTYKSELAVGRAGQQWILGCVPGQILYHSQDEDMRMISIDVRAAAAICMNVDCKFHTPSREYFPNGVSREKET